MRGKPKLIQLTDKYGNLKSPFWYIHYYDRGRSRRCSTGYQIGTEDHKANLFLAAWTLERERPQSTDPQQLMITQALKDYRDEHLKHTASEKNADYYERGLKGFFGVMTVSDITQSKINQFVREGQERGLSNGTIRRQLEHLQATLNHEVREKRLLFTPKWKKPEAPAPRERILTRQEINKLIAACKSQHVVDFIVLMLNTGQRPGAVEKMMWAQVDFKARIIHFDKTRKAQTNKRVRPVYMNDTVNQLLKGLHKIKQTDYVLEYTPINTDKAIPANCVRAAFERAVSDAGLEDVSRYTLRHTFGNLMDDTAADEKTTSDIMGHTNIKTTRHHYIKSKMSKQRDALDGINISAHKVRNTKKRK